MTQSQGFRFHHKEGRARFVQHPDTLRLTARHGNTPHPFHSCHVFPRAHNSVLLSPPSEARRHPHLLGLKAPTSVFLYLTDLCSIVAIESQSLHSAKPANFEQRKSIHNTSNACLIFACDDLCSIRHSLREGKLSSSVRLPHRSPMPCEASLTKIAFLIRPY